MPPNNKTMVEWDLHPVHISKLIILEKGLFLQVFRAKIGER